MLILNPSFAMISLVSLVAQAAPASKTEARFATACVAFKVLPPTTRWRLEQTEFVANPYPEMVRRFLGILRAERASPDVLPPPTYMAAVQTLQRAKRLRLATRGILATTPIEVYAYWMLLDDKQSALIFKHVLCTSESGGRIFALAGLWLVDPPAHALFTDLLPLPAEITVENGCITLSESAELVKKTYTRGDWPAHVARYSAWAARAAK